MPIEDPLLYVGIDVGIKRDTTAISSVYPMSYRSTVEDSGAERIYAMWACAIFHPPVNMITQVQPYLARLLKNQRIVKLGYDPYQMATTSQWLEQEGYGDLCEEINQNSQMILAANTLHSHCWDETFVMPKDGVVRSHFTACAAEYKERGWRIVKQKQSKQIDGVVATAMALMMATEDRGHIFHPSALQNKPMSVTMLP